MAGTLRYSGNTVHDYSQMQSKTIIYSRLGIFYFCSGMSFLCNFKVSNDTQATPLNSHMHYDLTVRVKRVSCHQSQDLPAPSKTNYLAPGILCGLSFVRL